MVYKIFEKNAYMEQIDYYEYWLNKKTGPRTIIPFSSKVGTKNHPKFNSLRSNFAFCELLADSATRTLHLFFFVLLRSVIAPTKFGQV